MKRKIVLALSFLLALCLLLSSCAAAGIQPPALFGELEKTATDKGHAIKGLFENLTVLCENGEMRVTLVADGNYGSAVAEELRSMQKEVLAKTGVALPLAKTRTEGKKAIVAELISTPAKIRETGLNNSIFRIYFTEGDLHIAATTEIMLAAGLRAFTDRFVTGESATADSGYLAIPADTDFTAEQSAVFGSDGQAQLAILYPEKASERVKAAASLLFNTIKEMTGKSVKFRSDFSTAPGNEREILVGACDREGVAEEIGALDNISYRVVGSRADIRLLGNSDAMVEAAVNAFISAFLQVNSSYALTGALTLPLSFSLSCTLETVTAAERGQTEYVLVYPADASAELRAAALSFADSFYLLTGATLPVCADTELPFVTAKEIRFGVTNRTTPNEQMGEGDWNVVVRDIIQIRGGSDAALKRALTRFSRICSSLVYSQNEIGESFNGYTPKLLYFIYGTEYSGTIKI